MNKPELELARNVVQLLNEGTDRLDADIRERLLESRKEALARYRQQPVTAPAFAWAGPAGRLLQDRFDMRAIAAGAALIVALAGALVWQDMNQGTDITEIDAGLLTDDLPITAYLDQDFDSWLKRSGR